MLSNGEIAVLESVHGRFDEEGPWTIDQYLSESYAAWGGVTQEALDDCWSIVRRLTGLGYLKKLSMSSDYDITDDGILVIRELHRLRSDPGLRSAALQRGLLSWLYEFDRRGVQPPTTQYFVSDNLASFAGEFATDTDVQRVVSSLKEKLLIDGHPLPQTRHLASPRLTALGSDCIESGGTVAEFLARSLQPASQVFNIDASGAGNFAFGTQGDVTQSYSAGVSPEALSKLAQFAAMVHEGLSSLGLDSDQQVAASSLADELEHATQDGKSDKNRLRKIGSKLLAALGPATSTALTGVITAFGQEAVKAIGG